jgi:predicted O-methyltransferase YrrM
MKKQLRQLIYGTTRPSTKWAKVYFQDKPVRAVEVGTRNSANAKNIIKNLNVSEITLIDIDPIKEVKGNVRYIVEDSSTAHRHLKGKYDFIYIDGDHSEEQVFRDISNFYPFVKDDGIIAGHDITYISVATAVMRYFGNKDLLLHVRRNDWWLLKRSIPVAHEILVTLKKEMAKEGAWKG